MRKFRKNNTEHKPIGLDGFGKSQTRPDQAMSVRTILNRYASGLPTPLEMQPVFTGDLEDFKGMDLADRHNNLIQLDEQEKQIKDEISKRRKQTSKKKEETPNDKGTEQEV